MSEKSVIGAVPPRSLFGRPATPPGRRTIGILTPSYGMERVSYMIPSARHGYVRLSRVPLQRLERRGTFLDQTPLVVGPRVDLIHTFNQIVANRRFGVSVEMELPRYLADPPAWQRRLGLRLLASERCRGIWPLSEAARAHMLRRFARDGFPELADKVAVFRGAVAPLAPGADRPGYPDRGALKLLFVGGDGLRKGLGPALEAAERLRRDGVEVEMTVIGRPGATVYVVPGHVFPTARVEELLARPWVTHHAALPNAEVRRLMGLHDIFVFPTIDESLGWVVAEAAMSGTPTLSTNIFALPELVLDGDTGWTIKVPLNEDLRWAELGSPGILDAWQALQADMTDRLVETIASIAADRGLVERFGRRARDHIARLYGIDVAAAHLDELYARACGD